MPVWLLITEWFLSQCMCYAKEWVYNYTVCTNAAFWISYMHFVCFYSFKFHENILICLFCQPPWLLGLFSFARSTLFFSYFLVFLHFYHMSHVQWWRVRYCYMRCVHPFDAGIMSKQTVHIFKHFHSGRAVTSGSHSRAYAHCEFYY